VKKPNPALYVHDVVFCTLRHLYEKTSNPLYVWQAISLHRFTGDTTTIPEWCLPYLRESAGRLCKLANKLGSKRKKPSIAKIAEALSLSSGQGKCNALDDYVKDRDLMVLAYGAEHRWATLDAVAKKYNITLRQAKRRVAEGGRLLDLPKKSRSKLPRKF
jgi:hypothetical protein